jgi:hypothetical protein
MKIFGLPGAYPICSHRLHFKYAIGLSATNHAFPEVLETRLFRLICCVVIGTKPLSKKLTYWNQLLKSCLSFQFVGEVIVSFLSIRFWKPRIELDQKMGALKTAQLSYGDLNARS